MHGTLQVKRPWKERTSTVNNLGIEGEDRVRDAYGAEKFQRLTSLKPASTQTTSSTSTRTSTPPPPPPAGPFQRIRVCYHGSF
jgi:hypothetical protein